MKTPVSLLVLLAVSTLFARAQDVIRPVVAPEFGQPVTVQAEFVAKSNDYHSRNIVAEPYTLKVMAVNGHPLKEPVLMEYNLHAEGKQRARIERPGAIATFEAYESLYQPAMASPWLADWEQGTAFALIPVLHVRLPKTKG